MYSSKRSKPPASPIARRTSSCASLGGTVGSPGWLVSPRNVVELPADGTGKITQLAVAADDAGYDAEDDGEDPGDRQRGLERAGHADRGDVAVRCRLHPHLTHHVDVVRRGDDGVDRRDDGE